MRAIEKTASIPNVRNIIELCNQRMPLVGSEETALFQCLWTRVSKDYNSGLVRANKE